MTYKDRALGSRLPLQMSDEALLRIKQRMAEFQPTVARELPEPVEDQDGNIRFAALEQLPDDFEKLESKTAIQYRQGHQIWELQAVDDSEYPFQLVRKQEERHFGALDRDWQEITSNPQPRQAQLEQPQIRLGQHVSTIRDGRVAEAIVIMIDTGDDTADIRYPDGMQEEAVPMEMLTPASSPPPMAGAPVILQLVSDDGEDEEHPTDAFEPGDE